MYIPNAFKEEDSATLLKIMKENAFATLITTDENGKPVATPIPFLIKNEGEQIILQAHLARANAQYKHLESNSQVLVVFQGSHCYVSPSWYKSAGVPTWNYVTVQAYGNAKLYDDEGTMRVVEELSNKYESKQNEPWEPKNNMPEAMLKAIIGFEITVQELQGKVKIGQNKSEEDLLGVVKALDTSSSSEQEKTIVALIKNYLATT